MNTGAFGEGFPYTNFHDLNMDWIIKIAKDFLDQYTHIQEIIEQGKTDIQDLTESGLTQIGDLTDSGLTQLQEKADALEALLQQWYDTHSSDIANQLADALADLNAWYTTHQNYLDQTLQNNIDAFDAHAEHKAETTIASIPDDYTTFFNDFTNLKRNISNNVLADVMPAVPRTIAKNGVTWTIYPDGTFEADGATTTNESTMTFAYGTPALNLFEKGVDYLGNIYSSDGSVLLQVIQYIDSAISIKMNTATTGYRFSLDNTATSLWLRINVPANTTVDHVKGKFSIVKATESEHDTIIMPTETRNERVLRELLYRRYKAGNEYDTINFSDLPLYMDSTLINNSGDAILGESHRVMFLPAGGITEIYFNTTNTNSNIIGAIKYGQNGFIPLWLRAGYLSKVQGLFPEGLPEDAIIILNWFTGNSTPNIVTDNISVKYFNKDYRVVPARNKLNPFELSDGCEAHYSNGEFYGLPAYSTIAIPISAGDVFRMKGADPYASHVVFKDKYGAFISGTEVDNTGIATLTAPANSAMVLVSIGTEAKDRVIVTINDSNVEFERFHNALTHSKYPYSNQYIYKLLKTNNTPAMTSKTNNNTVCLKLPATYTEDGNPTPLVIMCHGASGGISSDGSSGWTYDSGYNSLVTALNNAGFAVMDSNGYDDGGTAGHEHWGCPQALAGYVDAYQYFTDNYNLDKLAWIYGFSMGGLTALNIISNKMIPIRCAMVGVPVISLYDQCVTRQGGGVQNPYFLTAYNISAYDRTKLMGCDRYLDIIDIGSTPTTLHDVPPLFIGYGTEDTNISNQKIQDYYNALYNSNRIVRLKAYTGGHGVGFGGSAELITDMVNWFNSFR